ncbi:unnamed protein product, partial [Discosporangium mesarthrocarpum]
MASMFPFDVGRDDRNPVGVSLSMAEFSVPPTTVASPSGLQLAFAIDTSKNIADSSSTSVKQEYPASPGPSGLVTEIKEPGCGLSIVCALKEASEKEGSWPAQANAQDTVPTDASVTALQWLDEGQLVCGLEDGMVILLVHAG